MPNKTLYLRPEDVTLWDAANEHAMLSNTTISRMILAALQEYMQRHETTMVFRKKTRRRNEQSDSD